MSDRLNAAVTALSDFRKQKNQDAPDLFTAIESVAEHAGPVWRLEALRTVEEIARRRPSFSVADLDGLLPPTLDKRAIGWVLRQGARRGWYSASGYVNGGASRHARPVVLWKSHIYEGTDE